MSKLISFFIAVFLFLQGLPYGFKPVIQFNLADSNTPVKGYATGFLYGMACKGVPSDDVIKSLNITSVSQKVVNGLQHPIGDVTWVESNLESCDYITVYLQDAYSTWYYCYDEIKEGKRDGSYNAADFVREDFIPKVREAVGILSEKEYSSRIVYCPFNECDNAVWFGTLHDDGWNEFDESSRYEFYLAWQEVYDEIKAIAPYAKIGGPGYCDYDYNEIKEFLSFCKDNNCIPDVMIYHELRGNSAVFLSDHVDEYRSMEKELSISELPIIITEYGTMQDCASPSSMLHFVTALEKKGVYGNIAYWRLADNLCDTITDGNVPNSQYWLYKWYSDMSGNLISSKIIDVLHSDFANTIKYARKNFHYTKLDGIGSYDAERKQINIIAGGCDYDFTLALKNLLTTDLGKYITVTVEAVTFEGISGEVYSPTFLESYTQKVSSNTKILIRNADKYAVFHITITPAAPDDKNITCISGSELPQRFEFEDGTLIGSAYTYDSAYATTGEINGMCGGFENIEDGVRLDFTVPEEGDYILSVVYGKHNDGDSPEGRIHAEVNMILDDEESVISLANTIKSEYTDKYEFSRHLTAGNHSITLSHKEGTFVVDSLLVKKDKTEAVYTGYEEDNGWLISVPSDGYYNFSSDNYNHYLKRGLNYYDGEYQADFNVYFVSDEYLMQYKPEDMILAGSAETKLVSGKLSVAGISSEGGSAEIKVSVDKDGMYALIIEYANNAEGGYHAYNVDLFEKFVTVDCNDVVTQASCVNTHSDENHNTSVVYVHLNEGENTIILRNDGHESFNNSISYAPYIFSVAVTPQMTDK